MRPTLPALCLCTVLLASPGCTRGRVAAPADEEQAEPKPAAVAQPPVAAVAANAVLGEDGSGKAVYAATLDAAKAALGDPDPAVRVAAVRGLGKVRWKAPEPLGGVLALALKDADASTRLEAIEVAAAHAAHTLQPDELLKDKDPAVRLAAARALVSLGKHEQAANPVLIAITLDPKDPLRVEAIGVLGRFGPSQERIDALLLTAHDAEPRARAAALRALGRLDPTSAKVQVALIKALRDPQPDVPLAATEAVGKDGVAALVDLLRHGDERLRDAAARALGRIGPADAWPAVGELKRLARDDPAERVRQSARAALKAIAPHEI
jgi:HEAT repeat protein